MKMSVSSNVVVTVMWVMSPPEVTISLSVMEFIISFDCPLDVKSAGVLPETSV